MDLWDRYMAGLTLQGHVIFTKNGILKTGDFLMYTKILSIGRKSQLRHGAQVIPLENSLGLTGVF